MNETEMGCSFIICLSSLLFMHEKFSFYMLILYISNYSILYCFKKLVCHLVPWLHWGHYFICCKRRYSITFTSQCLGLWQSQSWWFFKYISGTWCVLLAFLSLSTSCCCSCTASFMEVAGQVPTDIAIQGPAKGWRPGHNLSSLCCPPMIGQILLLMEDSTVQDGVRGSLLYIQLRLKKKKNKLVTVPFWRQISRKAEKISQKESIEVKCKC